MKQQCESYFKDRSLPDCLAPNIGANYQEGGVMVVTRHCFLPDGSTELKSSAFYDGKCSFTEKERSTMDNTAITNGDHALIGISYNDFATYRFILRPMKNRTETKNEVTEADLKFAVEAFTKMIDICKPRVICFCGYSLKKMVESAFAEFSTTGSFSELAKNADFSYTTIYDTTSFYTTKDDFSRSWFTNFLQDNREIHGKAKLKLISQVFDRVIENDDYEGILNLVSELQKELDYKSDSGEQVSVSTKAIPEKVDKKRSLQNAEARKKRTEKQKLTVKSFWDQYVSRSSELFENTPVKVWPYIGNDYFDSEVRILSLGESHYKKERVGGARPDLSPDSTIDVFLGSYQWNAWEYRNGSFTESVKYTQIPAYCRCYRRIAAMISESKSGDADYVNDKIAFMNYFQCVVGNEPRDFRDGSWITDKDKQEADQSLFDGALPKLQPDIVIVWGDRLFRYIKNSGRSLTPIDGGIGQLFEYQLKLSDTVEKKILFLVVTHPSAFGKGAWSKEYSQNQWQQVKERFPQIENVSKHHPALENVFALYTTMRNKYKGLFLHFFSELSYSMALFPFENGIANGKSPRCMFAELAFDKNMNATIRFNTRDFNEDTCRKILEHPIWAASDEVLESCENGKFTLGTFPAGTTMEALEAEINKVAQKMIDYRKAVAW